jgi:hypothetical protein
VPTQLQLEGPDLESLLNRVKTELGAGARIVRAEKVRTGGVGGFFAKQRFEISVEVEGSGATLPGHPVAPAPLLDLPGLHAPVTPASPASRPGLRTPSAPTVPAPLLDRPSAPVSLLDLADQVSASERTASRSSSSPTAPAVSTETSSFAGMLAKLGVASGQPEVPAHGPPDVREQRPARPSAASGQPEVPAHGPPDVPEQRPAVPRQRVASEPTTALSLRPLSELAVRTGRAWPATVALPSPQSGQLARLGLPEHLRPAPEEGALYPALVQSLRRLPKVPRTTNRAGAVLAVVGPLPLALDVAREIARDLGLPVATAVVLASSRRGRSELPAKQVVRTPEIAAERRELWRRRRNLTIVAVDAPLSAAGAAQARAFLSALGPVTTYGVVEATRKAHDVGAWTRALGGVQAIALTGVEETADPAAVLELGIPVGRLSGRPATAAAWATLLADRLAA